MNKFFISALLITSTTIFSQELDQAYLESLPEEIRKDVLSKIDQRETDEKPVYRRQSTMTDKPFSEEELDSILLEIFNGDEIINKIDEILTDKYSEKKH